MSRGWRMQFCKTACSGTCKWIWCPFAFDTILLFHVAIRWTNMTLVAFLYSNTATGQCPVAVLPSNSTICWVNLSDWWRVNSLKAVSCLNVYYNDMSMYAYCFNCVMFTDALLRIVTLQERNNSASTEHRAVIWRAWWRFASVRS